MHHEETGQPWLNRRPMAAGYRCRPDLVARQVHQHQVLGKLFVIGTHFRFDTACVEIMIQRTVGAAAARRVPAMG